MSENIAHLVALSHGRKIYVTVSKGGCLWNRWDVNSKGEIIIVFSKEWQKEGNHYVHMAYWKETSH